MEMVWFSKYSFHSGNIELSPTTTYFIKKNNLDPLDELIWNMFKTN